MFSHKRLYLMGCLGGTGLRLFAIGLNSLNDKRLERRANNEIAELNELFSLPSYEGEKA